MIVEELQDETLVYDLNRHKARCLKRTAALVWGRCDGRTSVSEVAALLEEQSATPFRRGGRVDGVGPLGQGSPAE